MSTTFHLTASAAIAVALAGCDLAPRTADATPVDSLQLRPGYVVDSILPMDEMLRRFRARLGVSHASLADGPESHDALVRGLVRALAGRDTTTLRALHINCAQFAWLYFPSSPFASPPYELPPEVLWLQIVAESDKGLSRAMRVVAPDAEYLGHACISQPGHEDRPRLWTNCTVRWTSAGAGEQEFRLFGSILEHGGRFKFVSYANGL
jgi:hypothetical protein